MKYSQKYTIVAFTESIEPNYEFAMGNWPLHITLADTFAVELNETLVQNLKKLLALLSQIDLSIGNNTTLGTTKAALIDKNNALQGLHNRVVDLLESSGAKFNNPEFTRAGFLPHITNLKSFDLQLGDTVRLKTISVIDMFPDGNWQQRKVLNSFELK